MKNHNFLYLIFFFLLHFNSLFISLYKNDVSILQFSLHQQLKKNISNFNIISADKAEQLVRNNMEQHGAASSCNSCQAGSCRAGSCGRLSSCQASDEESDSFSYHEDEITRIENIGFKPEVKYF